MEKHPLYGKKKKKKEICPNPLFVQWLTEWRDSAVEKGIKSQYTYGKALNTLKKFPLKFDTGKECKILENFGDKICKMLDEKLAEHVSLYGTTAPIHLTDTLSDIHDGTKTNCKMTKSKGAACNSKKDHVPKERSAAVRVHDLSDNSDDDIQEQPARKRQRSGQQSGEREYIPVYRSGPYALLLTLYREMQSPDSQGFLSKTDLVRKAQPLADKSFTMADPGCRYTAWSSMGSLIKKGLVIKESSPARYSITDSGCELAHKLQAVKEDASATCDTDIPFQIHDPGPTTSPVLPTLEQNVDAHEIGHHSLSEVLKTQINSGLKYWYITDEGSEVLVKDKAAVSIDEEIGVGFLVKCNYTELLKSGKSYKLDTTRPLGDDFVYVYLRNEDTDNIANPPFGNVNTCTVQGRPLDTVYETESQGGNQKSKNNKPRKKTSVPKAKDTLQLLPLIHSSYDSKPASTENASSCNNRDNIVLIDSEDSSRDSLPSIQVPNNDFKHKNTNSINLNSKVPNSSSVPKSSDHQSLFDRLNSKQDIPKSLLLDSQDSVSHGSSLSSSQCSIKSISSVSSSHTLPVPDFALCPGEFDIVLCIDNAEFYGASKGCSKTLLPDLIKNGIDCDLRKLHVGDILWIAKEKSRPVQGQLSRPPGRELVLNYIIERKRMDDLVGSCIDGRFKEQKFRLKKCGLHHTMYLIEDYGSTQHFSLPESTIKQAITNTQVIDGFQVKRTKDTKETVAFLTVFTRYLQSHFKDKTLYACSLDEIKESNIVTCINDNHQTLATFEEFNQGSVKSKALTVQEMFGKQLIQLHGMSAEKARAVIAKYPTPSHLFKAFDSCCTEKEKENLLAAIKCGKSSRSLGQAQGKQIYQLYNTCAPLS